MNNTLKVFTINDIRFYYKFLFNHNACNAYKIYYLKKLNIK